MIDGWRSEEMQLVRLIMPTDAAHKTISELGELGLLQFKDLNSDKTAFARTYASQVKRCNEMCRRLRFFHEQVTMAEIPLAQASPELGHDLDELEAKLEELEKELTVINENSDRLQKSRAELHELQLVLEKAGAFFDEARQDAHGARAFDNMGVDAPLLEDVDAQKLTRLGFMAGTIEVEKLHALERLLFRATRGNMFLRHTAVGRVVDPNTNKEKEKAVFVVFFAGDRAKLKIAKTCEAFSANRYPLPEDSSRQHQMHSEVSSRLRELASTIEAGDRHRNAVLQDLANNLASWITVVRREKAVYHILNQLSFDVTRQALVAEAWAPIESRVAIQEALQRGTELSNASVGTIFQPLVSHEPPPTYFRTTMFTSGFQGIVDAYGVARYREVNPATWTIITFPFLFAVMFGDVGHALMMLAFAVVLIAKERTLLKQKLDDMTELLFGGRYLILLMALFSIFTGFMYNEFFSLPITWPGSGGTHYTCNDGNGPLPFRDCASNATSTVYTTGLELNQGPYPYGMDPVWRGTKTELSFFNSVKMKMSILMGVAHMTLGIIMSLHNHLYFRDQLSLVCEFVPQMIFLWSLFGYLSFLIVFKWVSWGPDSGSGLWKRSYDLSYQALQQHGGDVTLATARPADLYHIMIYMFLAPTDVQCSSPKGPTCTCNSMYDGQTFIQVLLVLAALVAVPWMLLPKPLILKQRHEARTLAAVASPRVASTALASSSAVTAAILEQPGVSRAEQQGYATIGHDVDEDSGNGAAAGGHGHGHGDHFEFGEIMVHQMIHTIEFVLGAVSNTASYLRLWALSLAHSQLSAVFYDKVLMYTITTKSPILMVIGTFMWLMATLGVLLVMESLSAFLHALRLHWVEFQNKFYHGDGFAFAPFAYSVVDNDNSFLEGVL